MAERNKALPILRHIAVTPENMTTLSAAEPIAAAKNFARTVVAPAAGRAILFALLSATLFFIAGWVAYSGIAGLLLPAGSSGLRALVALIVVVFYTCAGGVIGLVWGAASSIARRLSKAEELIHQLTASLTSRILEHVPLGQEGVSTDEFVGYVDRAIVASESSATASGVRASAGAIARGVMRRFLPMVRNILAVNFVEDLRSRGETRVTSAAVERFTREKMVGLASKFVRLKLYAIRKTALVVGVIALLVPVVLLIAGHRR